MVQLMENTHTPKYPVQSLEKALDIMNLLAMNAEQNSNGISIGEISKKLSIGKSTVHRLLDTLLVYRFVEKTDHHGTYRLGWGVYQIGCAARDQHSIFTLDFSALDEICDKYNESVNIGISRKNNVVIVHKNESNTT